MVNKKKKKRKKRKNGEMEGGRGEKNKKEKIAIKRDSEDCFSSRETDDEVKRKREQEAEEVFRKSKLTKRSPSKSNKDKSQDIETLMGMMKQLMDDNKEMMKELKQIRKEQKENHEEMVELKQENEKLKLEVKQLNERIEYMEKINKKKNLIITGLEIDTNDDTMLRGAMENFIKDELKVEIKLRSAGKIGDRVCVIETESVTDKINILKNKSILKNHKNRVYINEDLTKEERVIQKMISKIAAEERGKGNRTKIGYKKLYINGIMWMWNKDQGKLCKVKEREKTKN